MIFSKARTSATYVALPEQRSSITCVDWPIKSGTQNVIAGRRNGQDRGHWYSGSDVYDKLLILRALRPQFPNALFFTTDLDAQLLHPADFRWTRNLIVASSFGLDLNRKLPGKIPPFRGNYQTSIFLSTLLATKFNYPYGSGQSSPDISTHDELLCSGRLRFCLKSGVMGRNDWDLSRKPDTLHPFLPESPDIRNTVYVFLFILFLIVVVHQRRPFSGWIVFWSVLSLLFAINLAFMAIESSDGGEPMSLTQG